MDPPAYTPPEPTRPVRSIQDLRAQIIANGSVIRPRTEVHKSSDDHLELIVAKTPPLNGSARTHWTEKDGAAAFNRRSQLMRPMPRTPAVGGAPEVESSSASGDTGEKHYAVLMKRTGSSRTIYIIIQGEPRDTVEEALDWMLERTEMMMHDLVVRNGRADPGDGCAVT